MSTDTLPVLASRGTNAPARGLAGWRLNPFLHLGPERIYDPLTDRLLASGEAGFAALARLVAGGAEVAELPAGERELLAAGGWLLPAAEDPSRRFLLKYVSLEAHTVCNQTCYFCPVSIAPREDYFMPTELYERIVGELAAFRETIDGVFMINYNEPTLDKRFVEQVRTIKDAGLPPAVLTNATGLTFDLTARGMGVRCQRFSMLVDNGVVKSLNVEAPGKFEVSDGATMLTQA